MRRLVAVSGAVAVLAACALPVVASRSSHDATLRELVRTLDGHLDGVPVTARHAGIHPPYSSNRCQLFAGALVPADLSPPPGVSVADGVDSTFRTCATPGVREALMEARPGQAVWFLAADLEAGLDSRCR
jgi:hypothetical protein